MAKLQEENFVVIGLTCVFKLNFLNSCMTSLYFTLLQLAYVYNISIAFLKLLNTNPLFNATKQLMLAEAIFSVGTFCYMYLTKDDGYMHLCNLICYETILLLVIELLVVIEVFFVLSK